MSLPQTENDQANGDHQQLLDGNAQQPADGDQQRHESPLQATGKNRPELSAEALVWVARHLAGLFAFGTLSNLNVSCRKMHQETLNVLYETVVLRYSESLSGRLASLLNSHSEGFRHVRYVALIRSFCSG
jgi:hypothetical protein